MPHADDPAAAPAEAPAPGLPVLPTTARVTFSGSGSEYFRIWIVNVALTILTLGLYSAWAKVRRLQYFHRHTRLAGTSFDYHGDPIAIFKGRLVGAGLFLLYTLAGAISPIAAIAAFAVVAAIMPWMLVRSLRFRYHSTSYRGLRFGFHGTTRGAYWVFLGLPLLTIISFGWIGPFWHQRLKRYQFSNASYGQVRGSADPSVGDFYVVYVLAGILGAMAIGVLAALLTVAVAGSAGTADDQQPASYVVFTVAAVALYVTGLLTVQGFVTARTRNLVWNATTLGRCRFTSVLRSRQVIWLLLTNLLATIGTLGLFWPFAQIRLARCLSEAVTLVDADAFDQFSAAFTPDEGAVGEEVAGFFDFDIAF